MRKTDRDQAPFAADVDRPAAADAGKPSPMMAQYLSIKAAHPDALLFYRMGDFYELFFEDAEAAARTLGIVLTRRGRHDGADIPMCGVPVERHEDYLHRLIKAGHRVAICEQIEDPAEAKKRGSKSVVARAVVRLVTPGTLSEERLLEPARANWLLGLVSHKRSDGALVYGLAAIDMSTGAFEVGEHSFETLGGEITRIEPSEIVLPDNVADQPDVARLLNDQRVPLTRIGREPGSADRRLAEAFGLATLEGLGGLSPAEINAAALAVFYLDRTQCGSRPKLDLPLSMRRLPTMEIDASTRANLELTRTLAGAREGSLLATIDMCVTPPGSRCLATHLANPLTDLGAIEARLDAVDFFLSRRETRADVRATLRSSPDVARIIARLALDRGGPRDLAAVGSALKAAAQIAALIQDETFPGPPLPDHLTTWRAAVGAPDPALPGRLDAVLADDLPLQRRDGGFVRAGFDPQLDKTRQLRDASRKVIAGLQQTYCDLTGSKRLKIKHNNMLGYFVEVPQALGEAMVAPPLNATFIHRQTMADAMRFSTADLSDLEAQIAAAGDQALAREIEIFETLKAELLTQTVALDGMAQALAEIDVASALAEIAATRDWVRPKLEPSGAFVIEGGRHPVVERALAATGGSFVTNDCDLTGDVSGGLIAVVTGPNMAGKSTFLRQNALMVVLAQMGSFVPARSARIGIVDRLFSRVGAADDLARGRSTFMVEMVETAAILNRATPRSLVILDEIGRGTATFDGLSIAWAVMEHLHDKNRARALFATHFHELTELSRRLNRLTCLTMRVADWRGDVVFLHEIVPGAADRSYGIQVAKLAGLPPSVVRRAKNLLAELEAGDRGASFARRLADLPLFAATTQPNRAEVDRDEDLRVALQQLDPDRLSPREALEALYNLKSIAQPNERHSTPD